MIAMWIAIVFQVEALFNESAYGAGLAATDSPAEENVAGVVLSTDRGRGILQYRVPGS
jgi:hypothetical protein